MAIPGHHGQIGARSGQICTFSAFRTLFRVILVFLAYFRVIPLRSGGSVPLYRALCLGSGSFLCVMQSVRGREVDVCFSQKSQNALLGQKRLRVDFGLRTPFGARTPVIFTCLAVPTFHSGSVFSRHFRGTPKTPYFGRFCHFAIHAILGSFYRAYTYVSEHPERY